MSSFESLNLAPALIRATTDLGWTKPTPIQLDAVPPARDGRDVLACAQTGSGKTGGFLLPVLHRLLASQKKATRALILTPTRELAAQVHADFVALAKHSTLRGAAIFGGVGMGPQEAAFRHKVDVIIATPGRLLDHLAQPAKYVDFSQLEILVLDEADRMLDMGFLPAIKQVLRQIPAQRQTLFFSATLPAPIVELSKQMLKDPARLNVERVAKPAAGIEQAVWPVKESLKPDLFLALLKANVIGNVICFTRTKHRTNRLAEILTKAGVPNARIHGNRSQAQRTDALASFKDGKIRVLVATDIVARGIDVEALEHVLNFDVPHMPEDYIHRVGRTARAEATGEAFTLVSPEEEADLKQIEKAIHKKLPRRTLDGFDYGHVPVERFEVPLADRIAAIRARKKEERERAKAKLERKSQAQQQGQQQGRKTEDGRSGGRGAAPAPGGGRATSAGAGSSPTGGGSAKKRRRRRGGSGRGPGGGSGGGNPYRD